LPLWVEDGCRGGLGGNLVEPTILLVDKLVAKLVVSFLVATLSHVVLTPRLGASLDLLLMRFFILGKGLLLILILLLLFLFSIVLLVLLFLVFVAALFLVSSFVIFLDSRGPLEVGGKLELALKSRKFSLHCHDLVFIWGLCPPCSFFLQQVELVDCQQDELLMGEGECANSVGGLLSLDLIPEVVAWDDHVHNKKDVNGIFNCRPVGNDLCVVGVEVGVEQFNVSLDGRAVGR
jgi:hypothetical protein